MIQRQEDKGPQWAHERDLAMEAHMTDLMNQTAKALGVLNGGGALAMLGLLQALVQKTPQFQAYKAFGLFSLAVFVVGALTAALTFYARWQRSTWLLVEGTEKRRSLWADVLFGLLFAAVLAFLAGCTVAGVGIARL